MYLFFYSLSVFSDPVLKLRYPTGGRILSVVYDGENEAVYVLSGDRYIYRFSPEGEYKSRTNIKEKPAASASIGYDHTLYAGTESGNLIAVNPAEKIIWKTDLAGRPEGNPVPDPDGNLYVVTDSSRLYCISHTGKTRYAVDIPARPVMAPVLSNSGIMIFTDNSRIYLYSGEGVLKWEFLLSGRALSCTLGNNILYAGTETGTVAAVNMEGSKLWSTRVGDPVYSLVMPEKDRIAAVSGASLVSIGTDGKIIWKYNGRVPFYSVCSGENVIAVSEAAGSALFLSGKGHPLGSVSSGKPSTPFLPCSPEIFVSGSRDWNVYFINAKSSIVNPDNWKGWNSENGDGMGRRGALDLKERNIFSSFKGESNSYGYLKTLADADNSETVGKALRIIEKKLVSMDPDKNRVFLLPLLEYIASDCITRPDMKNGELINDFPVIRAQAAALLGEYGDFRTQEFFTGMIFNEWDSYSVRIMILSMGLLGYNPGGETESALYRYYKLHSGDYDSEELRSVLIDTVKELYRYNGILHEEGIRLAVEILKDSGRTDVKEKVLSFMNSIKK